MYRYQGGKGGGGMNWETEINIYTIDTMYRQLMRTDYTAQKTQLGSLWWPNGKGIQKEGTFVYVGGSVVETLPAVQEMWA